MGQAKASVLVTGATSTIGRQLCQALYYDERVGRVLATARDPEPYYFNDLDRTRFQYKQIDILKPREVNNLFLSETFRQAEIDSVVHLAFVQRPRTPEEITHTLNVEGTKTLLDRCIESGHIRKFVFRSSDAVYKIRAGSPILLDEEADLNFDPDASQYVRDRVDADMICRAQLANPHMKIVVLRPTSIIGRNVHSHWNSFLENHWVIFKLMGFDPMVCPTHTNDLLRALQMAIHKDVSGVFNISGLDVAPLSTFVRLAGAYLVSLPARLLRVTNSLQLALRLTNYDYQAFPEALRYHCLLDTTRAREVMGFLPQYHIKFG
jgi:nucleoside-diphosphate-sugar epimerase